MRWLVSQALSIRRRNTRHRACDGKGLLSHLTACPRSAPLIRINNPIEAVEVLMVPGPAQVS